MNFQIEVQEKQQNGTVEDRVEAPSPDSVAPTLHKMEHQDAHMAGQIATHKNDLAIHHKGEAGPPQSDRRPESVPVHHCVHHRSGQNRQNLKRLRKLKPHERHECGNRMVEEVEEGELPPPKNGENWTEHVEESGEVVDVGPEEDAAGGAGA